MEKPKSCPILQSEHEHEHYIDDQQQHHRARTFQQEYLAILESHGVDFDERYVWD